MKEKKETKKLALNKITIAQLDKDKMSHAKGGSTVPSYVQPTTSNWGNSCDCSPG
jgi:natural product precursor